jgi:hypothetical protein
MRLYVLLRARAINRLPGSRSLYSLAFNYVFRVQSLEYINAGMWKVTLEPEELGEVAD